MLLYIFNFNFLVLLLFTRLISPPNLTAWRFPSYLLLPLLLYFLLIFYLPLLFLPWLPCHFYLVRTTTPARKSSLQQVLLLFIRSSFPSIFFNGRIQNLQNMKSMYLTAVAFPLILNYANNANVNSCKIYFFSSSENILLVQVFFFILFMHWKSYKQ